MRFTATVEKNSSRSSGVCLSSSLCSLRLQGQCLERQLHCPFQHTVKVADASTSAPQTSSQISQDASYSTVLGRRWQPSNWNKHSH